MMDGGGAGFVSSGSCGVDIPESSGCNYKVQVYYQRIRNLDAFALKLPLDFNAASDPNESKPKPDTPRNSPASA